jgi:hypothetical protein
VPVEQVKEVHEVKPEACDEWGQELAGEDPEPHRHQVTEIPPVVAEVIEYRLHTLPAPDVGPRPVPSCPPGSLKGPSVPACKRWSRC